MHQLPTGTVTFLFADIEGSTSLLQQLGERYLDLLAECRDLLRTAFQASGGQEVDTQGDAFFVAFARATDAVSAAVAAQHALARHPWPEGALVRVRMGVHTGEPQRSAEGYAGLAVHHAARIMSAGHGGQILLSAATCELVNQDLPDGVSLRDLGEHRLKDLQHPSHLFQLVMADLPADFPALKTLDSHPHNLPIQPTPLIGREQQVAAALRLLSREEVRLVTLSGPGGVGKTRLGLQVAAELSDRFPDGVYFVNLAPLSDPEFVVPTIAQALSVKEIASQPLLDLLKASLREQQLLLLLDNFEQVVDAAGLIAALLAACPQLKIVVTSRMPLHVQVEHEFAVPSLALPDLKSMPDLVALSQYEAVALFIERARAVKHDFQVTNASAPAIAEICIRLDGLPLAIELAATRIKLLPPQALLARLGQRLALLTSGAWDAPTRQQTLRNTIQWSYDLLDAQAQRLFRWLSVFVGGCSLEAIEAVGTALGYGGGQVLDGVASLIDKSLLRPTEQEGEEVRLLMLETIREYGLEALEAAGEVLTTREVHARYYSRLAKEAEPELDGPQQTRWLERLEREHNNLRAAMDWLLAAGEAWQLGAALRKFWLMRGHFSDERDFLERALAGREEATPSVSAKVLVGVAHVAFDLYDLERAEALAQASLTLFREQGDTLGMVPALCRLGRVAMTRSDYSAARSLMEEALTLSKAVGNERGIADSLGNLSDLETIQGEYARAFVLLEESLALRRKLGDKGGIASSLFALGQLLFISQSAYPSCLSSVLTMNGRWAMFEPS